MKDVHEAWSDVGEQFEKLGTELRRHVVETGKTMTSRERDGIGAFRRSLEAGVRSLERTVQDPAVRTEIGSVVTALREALSSTFAGAEEYLRQQAPVGRRPAATKPAPVKKTTVKKTTAKKTPRPAAKKATTRTATKRASA